MLFVPRAWVNPSIVIAVSISPFFAGRALTRIAPGREFAAAVVTLLLILFLEWEIAEHNRGRLGAPNFDILFVLRTGATLLAGAIWQRRRYQEALARLNPPKYRLR